MKKLAGITTVILVACSLQTSAAEPTEAKIASGLGITMLKEGTGSSPKSSDTVKVHYRGVLANGKEFDSSYGRGQPATLPLNRVIPCWTEGVQLMKPRGQGPAGLSVQTGQRQSGCSRQFLRTQR